MRLCNLLLLLVAGGVVCACNEQQPTPPAAHSKQVSQASPAAASWPPPAPADLPVAVDLLADNWEFVLDASGSMGSSACGTGGNPRMETAKSGTIQFSRSLPERANLGLVVFSERKRPGIEEWVKLGIDNRPEFTRLVQSIQPQGGTPLRSSIQLGAKILTRQAQRQRGYGTYHLVIVTDGEADEGESPSEFTRNLVMTTPVAVHVIGFCVDGKHSLDIKGYTQYASASNPQTLERGLKAILAESETYADSQFVIK